MPRSSLLRRAALAAALLVSLPALAQANKPYHLVLEANPAAPFPFLAKFGTVDLHVYNGGVRADTVWLNGFSRSGSKTVTVENPFGRMYTEVPIAEMSAAIAKLGKLAPQERNSVPALLPPVKGTVKGIAATRHRLQFGEQAWIDLWTTNAIPENAHLKLLVNEFVRSLSPGTASVAQKITGVPVYVELNFNKYRKLPLLKMKELKFDRDDEEDALKVGAVYFRAPFLEALWKD